MIPLYHASGVVFTQHRNDSLIQLSGGRRMLQQENFQQVQSTTDWTNTLDIHVPSTRELFFLANSAWNAIREIFLLFWAQIFRGYLHSRKAQARPTSQVSKKRFQGKSFMNQ
jgi:hypothetical protein